MLKDARQSPLSADSQHFNNEALSAELRSHYVYFIETERRRVSKRWEMAKPFLTYSIGGYTIRDRGD
ncbi:hypothetical protein E4K67_21035 [Desulfosporosinus fructosivorans]|uniref:Uncharacterized protein n=1 Tax=Desulfosporosinus fructosivorans TaxID=2018669 RepID=A0A4Z0R048_9FIRM|nr:hypothetical protein E4K67_21035 [Desulfosporosinus fructosivorans]